MPAQSATSKQLEIIDKQLDRIENAIIGNGHEGLLARTARIEENLEEVTTDTKEAMEEARKALDVGSDKRKEILDTVHTLALNITKLEGIVSTHIGTDHLSVLMKKKQFWAIIVLGFISLHIIATYIPNLWDLIVTALGLPKLVIPLS